MTILIPLVPHIAYECLENLGEKNVEFWPKFDKRHLGKQKIKIAIQVNGRTREVLEVDKDLSEKDIVEISKENNKINKNLMNKDIIKISKRSR